MGNGFLKKKTYHVINRGNNRAEIFHKGQDYLRFTEMMAEAVERQPMRILSRKKYRTPLIPRSGSMLYA